MKLYVLKTAQYFAALKAMQVNGMELELVSAGALWCEAMLTEEQVGALQHNGISVREL